MSEPNTDAPPPMPPGRSTRAYNSQSEAPFKPFTSIHPVSTPLPPRHAPRRFLPLVFGMGTAIALIALGVVFFLT